MTSLRSGVKMVLMKKLSLYIFLVLMWCNAGFAEFYELNKCFIKGGFEEASFKSWEEFNKTKIVGKDYTEIISSQLIK